MAFELVGRLMFPFMLLGPLVLAFALVLAPLFAFALAFVFVVFAFAFVLVVFAFVLVVVFAFALVFAFAFMFPLALFVLVAGEHAVHTLATARRVRSAKVLRIEFPPVPLRAGSVCWGAARATGARIAGALPQQLRLRVSVSRWALRGRPPPRGSSSDRELRLVF